MNGPMRIARGCYGSATLTIVVIGHPVRSCWRRASLWTVPELWKTHRTRFPQLLGRRTERAAHNGPQASSFSIEKNGKNETTTMTPGIQGG